MNQYQRNYLKAKAAYKIQSAKYNTRSEYVKRFDDTDYTSARDAYLTAQKNLLNWGFTLLNSLKPGVGTELQQLYADGKMVGKKLDEIIDLTLRVKS